MEELRALRGDLSEFFFDVDLGSRPGAGCVGRRFVLINGCAGLAVYLEVGDANGRIFCDGEKKIQSGR